MRNLLAASLSFAIVTIGCAALTADPTPTPQPVAERFPPATSGIVIPGPGENEWSMADLLDAFGQVTGLTMMWNRDTQSLLENRKLGLRGELNVPAESVYGVVEGLVAGHEFIFSGLHDSDPRIIMVNSLQTSARQSARLRASYVPIEEIEVWSGHPAWLITTTVELDATDVRTLSNSLRTMLTDANTQQVIPAGSSSSLVLTGFGPRVADMVDMLTNINEASRAAHEKMSTMPQKPSMGPGEEK